MSGLAMASNINQVAQDIRKNYKLLGEIITWDLDPNTVILYSNVISALSTAGLETGIARKLLPRFGFSRAAKLLAKERIIRKVAEGNGKIVFQFTKEHLDKTAERYDYNFETTLYLDKESGAIECANTELGRHASELLARCIEERTTADITRIIKRLFEKNADLFPVRDSGSVYFVPDRHTGFVDQVGLFVSQMNGRLNRFPVPEGTLHGDRAVQQSVTEGLENLIKEHNEAIAAFHEGTRSSTLQKAMNHIDRIRFKIEAYTLFLDANKAKLEEQLELSKANLQERIQEIMAAKVAV